MIVGIQQEPLFPNDCRWIEPMRQKSSPLGRSRQPETEEGEGRMGGEGESELQREEDETEKTGLRRREMTAVTSPVEG